MKIGLISDTHDRLETLESAIKKLAQLKVTNIIHCGDWVSPFTLEFFDQTCQKYHLNVPIYSVLGNNDGADSLRLMERNQALKNPIKFSSKPTLLLKLNGQRLVVYHGHDKNLLNGLIESDKYDVVFHGHTHIARNEVIGRTLVLNPGSTAKSRSSHFVDDISIAVYDTETKKGKIIKLAENQKTLEK